MKPTRLITMALLATAALAVAGLTACSGSPDIVTTVVPPAAKESALTIALKPVDTRAAATDITTKGENTIIRVAVGIFDSDRNVKMVQTFESGEITSGTVKLTTTTALALTDHVLVACNAPADVFTGAIANEDAFRAKTITTDQALYGALSHPTENAVDFTNLPMFGHVEALTQSSTDGTQFTAAVSVYHLVAKITLESFTLDKDKKGAMANASFEPEGIFLAHVPNVLDFQNVTAVAAIDSKAAEAAYFIDKSVSYSTYYHGDMTKKTDASTTDFLGKAYLGMDAATKDNAKTLAGLVAYTMPNSQTDDANATFLVVKGKFHYKKSGDEGTEVWYPLYINYSNTTDGKHVGEPKKVYPNFNYRMRVTVQGFGEKPAYDKNGNPVITPLVSRTVAVTVMPQGFVDASSEVTLN